MQPNLRASLRSLVRPCVENDLRLREHKRPVERCARGAPARRMRSQRERNEDSCEVHAFLHAEYSRRTRAWGELIEDNLDDEPDSLRYDLALE